MLPSREYNKRAPYLHQLTDKFENEQASRSEQVSDITGEDYENRLRVGLFASAGRMYQTRP